MDRIFIDDLLVRGVIGVDADERRKRQDILVSLELVTDLRAAAQADDIGAAVNYRTVSKRVIERVETGTDFLVESLAEDLARMILDDFALDRVRVRVEKPGALRFAESVGVEIERSAEDREP